MNKSILAAICAFAALEAGAVTVTTTVTRIIASGSTLVPNINDCTRKGPYWSFAYNPNIPAGSTILSNRLAGFVDDSADLSGLSVMTVGACSGAMFNSNLMGVARSNGTFDIALYDHTSATPVYNQVDFTATNTITFSITDPPATPYENGDTNSEEALEYDPFKPCSQPCPDDYISMRVRGSCASCSVRGSPQPSFNLGTFGIAISDIPVWSQVAVGPQLDLALRFGNYSGTNGGRMFGPKWTCNWESDVRRTNSLMVMTHPSGGIVTFTNSGTVWYPPAALDGQISVNASTLQYVQSDGWCWQYLSVAGDSNRFRLDRVWDTWSNTVAVSYSNDLIVRVWQQFPASGRELTFGYNASGRVTSVSTESSAVRSASFVYDSGGWLTNVVDAAGYSYGYRYTSGFLSGLRKVTGGEDRLQVTYSPTPDLWARTNTYSVALTDGAGITRTYTGLFGIIDELVERNGASYRRYHGVSTVDGRGPVLSRRGDSTGRADAFTYNGQGRATNSLDRSGAVWKRAFNAQRRLTSFTDPLNRTTTRSYDTNGVDVTGITQPDGSNVVSMTYVAGRHSVETVSNSLGLVVRYAYNSLGVATSSTYSANGTTLFTVRNDCDAEGRITASYRDNALLLTNTYDTAGRLHSRQDAAGMLVTYSNDALDRVVSLIFNNGGQLSAVSNRYDCCFVDQVTDRRGQLWSFNFNDSREKISETNPKLLTTQYGYGVYGKPTFSTNEHTYFTNRYDAAGLLSAVEYPRNRPYDANYHAENLWYDAEGRLTRHQGVAGEFSKRDYDASGLVVVEWGPDGGEGVWGVDRFALIATNRYDANGRISWTRDGMGLEISNRYNTAGLVTQRNFGDGTEERWTYDSLGQVTGFRNRAGNTVSNIYDSLGRLQRRIDARSGTTSFGYDSADRLAAITNALLEVTSFGRDAEGRVTQASYPNGRSETRLYDTAGNVTQVVAGGVTTAIAYDELGQPLTLRIGGLLVRSNSYDSAGRPLKTVDGEGVTITNAYDTWNLLMARGWPQLGVAETYQYGDRGLTNATDRLGLSTRFTRDMLGRSTRESDPANQSVAFAYLTNGIALLDRLYDGNSNLTQWAYDTFGRPTRKTYANASFDTFAYDSLNRLTNTVRASTISLARTYDANGNVLSVVSGGTTLLSMTYDALDRRTNMVDAVGATKWVNDTANRTVTETGPWGMAVTASYDVLGRLDSLSFSGRTWTYTHDSLGRVASITAPEGNYGYTYRSNGSARLTLTYPNGLTETRGYDSLARLTNIALGSLLDAKLRYDVGDRITNRTMSVSGVPESSVSFGYDNARRLLSASSTGRPSESVAFTYDGADNMVRQTALGLGWTNGVNNLNQLTAANWTGGTLTVLGMVNYPAGTVTVNTATAKLYGTSFEASGQTVVAGTNSYTAVYRGPAFTNSSMVATDIVSALVGNRTLTYDADGNLTNDGVFAYTWDTLSRMERVMRLPSTTILSNRYDGLGRRLEAVRDGTNVERYVYAPNSWLVLAVLDATNGIKEVFTRGPDLSGSLDGAGGIGGLLSAAVGTTNLFHHPGDTGNTLLLTDSDGNAVATFAYTPYGRLTAKTGEVSSRFLFSGKEYEAGPDLYTFGHRFYVPRTGRWLSRDPLGEAGGINLTAFCGNDPINKVDPIGLENTPSCYNPERGFPMQDFSGKADNYFNPLNAVAYETQSPVVEYALQGGIMLAGSAVGGPITVYGGRALSLFLPQMLARLGGAAIGGAAGTYTANGIQNVFWGEQFNENAGSALLWGAGFGVIAQGVGDVVIRWVPPVRPSTQPIPCSANAAERGFVRLGGSEIRSINIRPTTDPKWGLTSKHLDKHFWGDKSTALKQIDPGGTTDKWAQHLSELSNAPVTGTTPNGMVDIIKQFPKADGSGMFKMGIRLSPRADGTYDLVTVLTRQ